MKKGVRILLIVLMLLISGAAYLYFRIRAGVDSAVNVQKLEDGFYYMEYRDDYGFDRFLEQGGAASDLDVAKFEMCIRDSLGIIRAALWDMTMPQILKLLWKGPRIVYIAATDGRYGGAMAVGDGIEGVHADQLFLDVKTPLAAWIRQIKEFKPNKMCIRDSPNSILYSERTGMVY